MTCNIYSNFNCLLALACLVTQSIPQRLLNGHVVLLMELQREQRDLKVGSIQNRALKWHIRLNEDYLANYKGRFVKMDGLICVFKKAAGSIEGEGVIHIGRKGPF